MTLSRFQWTAGQVVWDPPPPGRRSIETRYSPDQPRDEFGRWTLGGSAPPTQEQTEHAYDDAYEGLYRDLSKPGEPATALTDDEVSALTEYQGTTYWVMNAYLRKGMDLSFDPVRMQETETLQALTERVKTPEPARFYRGIDPRLAAQMEPGGTFVDKGFTSMTTRRDKAESFGLEASASYTDKFDRGAVLTIDVPAGASGLWADGIEEEFIGAPGSVYDILAKEIVDIHGTPRPEIHLRMRA